MGVYRADGESEMRELFDREGDSLNRAGFTHPEHYQPEVDQPLWVTKARWLAAGETAVGAEIFVPATDVLPASAVVLGSPNQA